MAAGLLASGCGKFVRDELITMQNEIDQIENQVKQMNASLSSLKTIVDQMAEGGYVVDVKAFKDEDERGGKVEVASNNKESMDAAIAKIKAIVALPEVGEVYEATVKSLMPYGCFVEFMPGKEGLLHISEIDWKRYETMEETGIQEGDKIMIKLLEIDPKTGKFRLSAKALKDKPADYVEPERPARAPRGERRPGAPASNAQWGGDERGDRGPRPERRGPRPERNGEPASRFSNSDGARLDRRH